MIETTRFFVLPHLSFLHHRHGGALVRCASTPKCATLNAYLKSSSDHRIISNSNSCGVGTTGGYGKTSLLNIYLIGKYTAKYITMQLLSSNCECINKMGESIADIAAQGLHR